MLTTRPGRPGEIGFDSFEPITDAMIPALKARGLTFAIRTIETLTGEELTRLAAAGFGVAWYAEARIRDWSADAGEQDGLRVAKLAAAAGFPPDASGGCDMESGVPSEAVAIAYANGWYHGATGILSSDAPILYRGAGCGFSSPETLFHELQFRRYWRSMSVVPNVAVRGDCLIQLFPPDVKVGGADIDFDVVQQDFMGGVPTFAIES